MISSEGTKYFMIKSQRMFPTLWGLNLQPPDHQSHVHQIEPLLQSLQCSDLENIVKVTKN